ncbi:MAG: matrixin family metalloprotease, partial [Cyanobacteria bacterium]|nr:matrixin family metalloprotease [Cyanobacteriota bacterium]
GPGPSNPNQYGSSGPSQSSGYYGVTQAPQFNPGQYQPQQQPQQQPYGQQGSYNQGPPNDPYSRMPANQNPYSGFPQYQNRPQYGGQGGYQNTAPQMGTQGYPPRQSYPNQSPQQGYQGAPQMGYQGQPRTGAQGYQQNPSSQAGGQGYQSSPQMGSQLPPPQMGSQGFQNPSAQQQQTPAPVNVGSASPAPANNIASAQNSGKPPEPPRAGSNSEMDNIVKSIPSKPSVGDYFASISRFSSGTVARWKSFPVLVHLPEGSPATWHGALKDAVESWGRYIPIRVAAVSEAADIEIGWINHLPPRALGQTNLEVFNGRMRVTVYLLRPSYYLPNVSQKVLRKVAEHEVGHALGIFGHSNDPYDLMFPIENLDTKEGTKYGAISPRDLNTLRRIYESPSL